jgi:hypothetical protein
MHGQFEPGNSGRQSAYSDDIATLVLDRVAMGESIRTICADPAMPAPSTIFKWLVTFQPFSEQYARAREACIERWSEEIIELADEPVAPNDNAAVQRARLRVDTRKWLMSKLAPRKYGDRVEHVIKSGNAADLTDDELARIAMAAAPALLLTAQPQPETEDSPTDNDTVNEG